jgi:hypothetical protein
MNRSWLGFVLTVVVLFPRIGNAQVFQFLTPPPDVSAAGAVWQIDSDPIVVGGLTYYPTRGFRLFDGHVMAQTGLFEGVPVYSDMTIEPYSELYVPLGSGRMRVYERRRERELAGTTGSHVPTFPVESPSVPPRNRIIEPVGVETDSAAGAGGTTVPRPASDSTAQPDRARPRVVSIGIPSVTRRDGVNGVWLEFRGARWYSNGPSVSFSPDRFEPIGEYQGFAVYRDKLAATADIWVSVVKDGPLAPYSRR